MRYWKTYLRCILLSGPTRRPNCIGPYLIRTEGFTPEVGASGIWQRDFVLGFAGGSILPTPHIPPLSSFLRLVLSVASTDIASSIEKLIGSRVSVLQLIGRFQAGGRCLCSCRTMSLLGAPATRRWWRRRQMNLSRNCSRSSRR